MDFDGIIGKPAALRVTTGYKFAHLGGSRLWTGICSHMELVHGLEPLPGSKSLSTYAIQIVPAVWLLTQRRNHRIFQHRSIPDIIDKLLSEWGIEPVWQIERAKYPKLEYKSQYGETDYDFLSRLLEEAGITFTLADNDEAGSTLTLSDNPHQSAPRPTPPIHYADSPNEASELEFVTNVRLAHEVRPGAHVIRDYDFRNPSFPLFGEGPKAAPPEDRNEQYHYRPGAFLIETGKGGNTPTADDKGVARHDQRFGHDRAERALHSDRAGKRVVSFDTNAVDLRPGTIFSIAAHPHPELNDTKKLLVTAFSVEGTPEGEWTMSGRAVLADEPHRPPHTTPKPQIAGVQSATVVGPKGQEIHTDEFGRVRVQFPWDRGGAKDDNSSCWIRVSEGWAGTGYGMTTIPRVGQEVLVGFIGGDPDQPIVVGRVFNALEPVPYKLPDNKTISTWKSNSSPGAGGFNEIKFEDMKGDELFYMQAEKNRRKLVKNDETITVVKNRSKNVGADETDTTGVNRTEVTGANRSETTAANRMMAVGADRRKRVKAWESERTDGSRLTLVGADQHVVTKKKRRELVEGDVHLVVNGDRSEKITGTQSLTIGGDQQEVVTGSHALAAGKQLHLRAAEVMAGEGGQDVTIKGPGGFLRIDAGGITIEGTLVKINVGGSSGKGKGSKPELPEEPEEAKPVEPHDGYFVVLEADTGKPIPNRHYRMISESGAVIEGLTDGEGRTQILEANGPEKLKLELIDGDEASVGVRFVND